jgi:hypothetical protein
MPWGFAGPSLMTAYLEHFNYKGAELKWFYPIQYMNWKYIFFLKIKQNYTLETLFPNSYGIHLWYGIIHLYNPYCAFETPSIYTKIMEAF